MQNIGCIEKPSQVLASMDTFDWLPPLELHTDMVDSMSPPHPAEYISAQHALAQDCATLRLIDEDIEACRARIARAYAQICLLERQRDAVQHRVSIHRARLSPLRAVPDQVLQEIFQHCLPDTPYVVPDAHSAPLVLTQVCRRWRAVAQGTSELWSSVALYDRGVWNYELEVEMMKRWLDRCRARPVRMSIACPPCTGFGMDKNTICSDIFQLVMAHSAQLSDLYLNVNKQYLHHFMDCASLPALRSIVISLHSVHQDDDPLELNTPALISAPNLRRIAFHGNGASIDLIPRTLFPQITYLSFDCNITLDLAFLFQDFPHLEHLSLALSLSRDTLRVQVPPQLDHRVVGPSLHSLDVSLDRDMLDFGDPEQLAAVLDQLELPALHTLSIAAPLRPRLDARMGRTEEAQWENYAEWVRSPSVAALLGRSRQGARFACRDLVASGGVW